MRKVIYPKNHQYLRKGKGQEVYPEKTVGKPGEAEEIKAVLVSFQNEAKGCHNTVPQMGLETTEIFSHSPGGWKFKIRVSVGLISSAASPWFVYGHLAVSSYGLSPACTSLVLH